MFAFTAIPAAAQSGPVTQREFDVPALPLNEALRLFMRQSGIQVSYESRDGADVRTTAVKGNFVPAEALSQLLAGTGLTYRFAAPTSVVLEPVPQASNGAIQLGPVRVESGGSGEQNGYAEIRMDERANGPVRGYIAHRSATATKTDVSVAETPQALTIVTQDQLQAQGLTSIEQSVRYTPGAVSEVLGPGTDRDKVYLRGFEPNYYQDGMMLPYGSAGYGSRTEVYGLERIEILRGPSSVMYGQNAPGGIINMVSKRPTETPRYEAILELADPSRVAGYLDLSGPLDRDGRLLYRVTAVARHGDTHIDQVGDDRLFIAPAITWQPSDATTLTILGQYQRDDSGQSVMYYPAWGTLLDNPHGKIRRGTNIGEPDHDRLLRNYYAIGYLFEHRFGDDLTFRQNLRYSDADVAAGDTIYSTGLVMDMSTGLPADYRTVNRYQWDVSRRPRSFTVDNQLNGSFSAAGMTHDVLIGLDYRKYRLSQTVNGGMASRIDVFAPVHGNFSSQAPLAVSSQEKQRQVGLYFEDRIGIGNWRLTLGGRYDWVDGENLNRLNGAKVKISDEAFTGRVGLSHQFSSGLMPYVSFTTSFQPVAGSGYGSVPFEPTEGRQWEAGLKFEPRTFNGLFSASLFKLTQRNVLTADIEHRDCVAFPTACGNYNTQTGEIEGKGFELEGRASVASGFNVIGNYAFLDAKVTRSNGADLGKRQILVPRHQASLWLDYAVDTGALDGLTTGAGVRYMGANYGDGPNLLRTPDYTLFDALLRYDLSNVLGGVKGASFSLNATNLFDKTYLTTCVSSAACMYGPGREITAKFTISW